MGRTACAEPQCLYKGALYLYLIRLKSELNNGCFTILWPPVPVAARSKEYVCGRSPAEIVGSNPTGGMEVCVFWVLCVLSGRGLCGELIPRSEESYRLWYVVVCDLETTWTRRPWPTGGCCDKKKYFDHSYVKLLLKLKVILMWNL